MIKTFVFDTNTLISAHLLKNSTSRLAYDHALRIGLIVQSAETITEFAQVFSRQKFDKYLSIETRLTFIWELEHRSLLFELTEILPRCRDPKDDMFLSLALIAKADCIISGDEDLLVMHPFENIPILNPTNFLLNFPS
jgi:putative PIN family toxin of toxin-antitoxin system